jgi:hypothetical protein
MRMSAYFVKVQRRGVAPLELTLLVRAESGPDAAGLATAIAERDRGGVFESCSVRPAPARDTELHPSAYDDG